MAGVEWVEATAEAAVVAAQTHPQVAPTVHASLHAAAVGMLEAVQHTLPAPAIRR